MRMKELAKLLEAERCTPMKQLAIDTSDADEVMVQRLADEAITTGEFSNWDHAYETLWVWLEYELAMQEERV
jgi:hypothetical protein